MLIYCYLNAMTVYIQRENLWKSFNIFNYYDIYCYTV